MKKNMYIITSTIIFVILIITILVTSFFVLYPTKYKKEILYSSEKYNLNAELVASIINVESGYNPNIVSNVGAMGLMQLMPKTAIEIANKLNLENFKVNDLFIPSVNIEFGCFYLRYLLDLYDGNEVNAIASYNAGLNNVNKWLISDEYHVDGTLNNIPFGETKNYLNKINKNIKIYKVRY